MGQVYLAEQISLKRRVALKILRADLAADPKYLQRFRSEAEAVAQATHANIVQVYAIGEADGLHFMALEYVEGRNLRDMLVRRGPPDLALVLSVMKQVAAALQRAAELGIVHRDIKPDNILLSRKGEVKVADFGLARVLADQPVNLTATGVTVGTPLYMSPEQVQGNALDSRSDMYSFGVTCYHMLAGEPPFTGDNAFQVALLHVNQESEPLGRRRPDLPPKLCQIVHTMMAKKPEDRYQTPGDLLADLAALCDEISTTDTEQVRAAVLGMPGVTGAVSRATLTQAQSNAATSPRWSRATWLALLSLPLWLLIGFGAVHAWLQHHSVVTSRPQDTTGSADDGTDHRLQSDAGLLADTNRRLEQYYRDEIEKHKHPANQTELNEAVDLCCNLGVYYLEHGKLDEADSFFAGLVEDHPPRAALPEHALDHLLFGVGRLGQGIVLSLRDRAEGSEAIIRAVLARPERADRIDNMLQKHSGFAQWLGQALERNRQNLGLLELPEPLEKYRKPR
jgi:serine/threonine-protein kinase